MKFLILILVVSPIYGFGVEDQQYLPSPANDHLRERRRAQQYRPISQAPAQIQQLLHSQSARDPIVHLPPQPPPQLAAGQRADPRYTTQSQVAAYRPQVQYGNAPQQPTYKGITPKVVPLNAAQPAAQPPIQQAGAQPNYRAVYRPVSAAQTAPQLQQPQYSSKLPSHLQQLVQLQAQLGNPPQQQIQPSQNNKIY